MSLHAQIAHIKQTNYAELTSTLYSSTDKIFVYCTHRIYRACHAVLILAEATQAPQNAQKIIFHKLAIGLSELANSDPEV